VNNTTVSGFDFCTPQANIAVASGVMGTIVTNNYMCDNAFNNPPGTGAYSQVSTLGASDLTFTANECFNTAGGTRDGGCIYPAGTGPETVEYNYCHDRAAKCFYWASAHVDAAHAITFKYNYMYNFGLNGSGIHAEGTFFCGNGTNAQIGNNLSYNVAYAQSYPAAFSSTLTAAMTEWDPNCGGAWSMQSDTMSSNIMIMPGTTEQGQVGSADLYFGCGTNNATPCNHNVMQNNYMDPSGGFYAYYPPTLSAPFPTTFVAGGVSGNINLLSGAACNPQSWQIDGGGTGSGTGC
jgi:hypothetical protein